MLKSAGQKEIQMDVTAPKRKKDLEKTLPDARRGDKGASRSRELGVRELFMGLRGNKNCSANRELQPFKGSVGWRLRGVEMRNPRLAAEEEKISKSSPNWTKLVKSREAGGNKGDGRMARGGTSSSAEMAKGNKVPKEEGKMTAKHGAHMLQTG